MNICYTSLFLLVLSIHTASGTKGDTLVDLINSYRRQNGLSRIPKSNALMKVAKAHCEVSCRVASLSDRECWNPHSWDAIPGFSQDYSNPNRCIVCGINQTILQVLIPMDSKLPQAAKDPVRWMHGKSLQVTTTSFSRRIRGNGRNGKRLDAPRPDTRRIVGLRANPITLAPDRKVNPPAAAVGGDGGDCLYLMVSGALTHFEGRFKKSGTSYGKPAYINNAMGGYWLYYRSSKWMISKDKGSYSTANGYCTQSNAIQCGGNNWKGKYSGAMKWLSCGGGLNIGDTTDAPQSVSEGTASDASSGSEMVVIGCIIGGVLAALMAGVIVFCVCTRRKKATHGVKVHDTEAMIEEEEEEEEEEEIEVTLVDENEAVEVDGSEATVKLTETVE